MNNFANTAVTPTCRKNRVSCGPSRHRDDRPLAWLQRCAGRLGLPAIAGVVADDLMESLPLAFLDAQYFSNSLVPGSAPVEVSFAETQPRALRVDLEPFCFGISPAERRQRAAAIAARWLVGLLPPDLNREYEKRLTSLCNLSIGQSARFGAFLGATFDACGIAEVKVYSEWNSGLPDGLPERLAETARTALATVPGLMPHFSSLSCGRAGCVPRLYFLCREEVPLLALYNVLETAGLSHRLAELACLMLPLAGVTTILPAGAGVLSFREVAGVLDCKLEILARALPISVGIFAESVRRSLAQRPEIRTALQHWWHAVGGINVWPEEFNAVGFRLSSTTPAQFGAYLSPERISKSRF
jgi:hypothetical protein